MMTITAHSCGLLVCVGAVLRCALGRGGVRRDKREGDGASPAGSFPLREIFYRADRVAPLTSALPARPLREDHGWSDDSADPAYNRLVTLPHTHRHERLWREDNVYDLLVPLGYNDDPPVAGKGSAIFLHVARPDYAPTDGCVALAVADLQRILRVCQPGDRLRITPPPC